MNMNNTSVSWPLLVNDCLTPKHRETHVCVVSTVATDGLVLKHQAISIHNADLTFIVLDQFHTKKCTYGLQDWKIRSCFEKKMTQSFKG